MPSDFENEQRFQLTLFGLVIIGVPVLVGAIVIGALVWGGIALHAYLASGGGGW